MARDSEYSGTSIGFNTKLSELGNEPAGYEGGDVGFVSFKAPPKKFTEQVSEQLHKHQPYSVLSKVFSSAIFTPQGRLLAGAALIGAVVAGAPEETGKYAGDVSAGFKAATTQMQLCKDDCTLPRIAGEKIGEWTVKFDKGFNSKFTQ